MKKPVLATITGSVVRVYHGRTQIGLYKIEPGMDGVRRAIIELIHRERKQHGLYT